MRRETSACTGGGSVLPGDRWLAGLAGWFGAGGLAVVQLLLGWWLWQHARAVQRKELKTVEMKYLPP